MQEYTRRCLDRYIKKYTDAKEAYSNAYEQYLGLGLEEMK